MADEAAGQASLDMELDPQAAVSAEPASENGGAGSKRARDDDESEEPVNEEKKAKVDDGEDKSVEEKRLGDNSGPVSLGPKTFGSAEEMFEYFYKFLHFWAPNLNLNKYEHLVLLELLKKGHLEPDKKIRNGVKAFQVRYHPQYKSRCFFLIRDDASVDDFSFRKCVDHILPLPENMQVKHDVNKALRGKGGNRGRGRCRGGR